MKQSNGGNYMNMTFKELSGKIDKSDSNRAEIDIGSIIHSLFGRDYHLNFINDKDCDRLTCYYLDCYYFETNYKMYFLDDVPVAFVVTKDEPYKYYYSIKWLSYEAEKSVRQYLESVAYNIRNNRNAKCCFDYYTEPLESDVDESIENLVNKD